MWNTYRNEFINKLTVLISIATGCRGLKRRDNLVVWPTEIEKACAFRGCVAIIRCNIGKGLNRIVNSSIHSCVYLEIDNGDDNPPWSLFDGLIDYSYFLTYISIVGHFPLDLPTGFKAIIHIFPHPKLCTLPLLSSPINFTKECFSHPQATSAHTATRRPSLMILSLLTNCIPMVEKAWQDQSDPWHQSANREGEMTAVSRLSSLPIFVDHRMVRMYLISSVRSHWKHPYRYNPRCTSLIPYMLLIQSRC